MRSSAPPPPPPITNTSVQQNQNTVRINFGFDTTKLKDLKNVTFDLEGIQDDGTFAPGSNATLIREGKEPFGCPIVGGNLLEGWVEFECRGVPAKFSCNKE